MVKQNNNDIKRPMAKRFINEEALYQSRTNDPLIQMDCVSPPIEGYFRIPAIWVGEPPDEKSVEILNPKIHHEKVFSATLQCGIKVSVQRDGLFLFDFSKFPLAPIVTIPGYRIPNTVESYTIPAEHSEMLELAESYSIIRARVMNVHQVFLSTAEHHLKRRYSPMGYPISAWTAEKSISFDLPPPYHDQSNSPHQLSHNVLNNVYNIRRKHTLSRGSFELNVVARSFEYLDNVLSTDPELLELIDATFIAATRANDRRYGEAMNLAWCVCEQLISSEWKKLIKEHTQKQPKSMNRERREKLEGKEFTSSIMIEMLQVNGKLDETLYKQLDVARRARNHWVHDMQVPKQREVFVAINAAEALMLKFRKTSVMFHFSGSGGVPQWPYWMWEELSVKGKTIAQLAAQL